MRFPCLARLLLILLLPVWLFDALLNRDPNLYIDQHYHLIAPWPGAPYYLNYYRSRSNSERIIRPKQLQDIKDIRFGERVITGRTENNFFIVDRSTNIQNIFSNQEDRNTALVNSYSTTISDLHTLDWTAEMKGNVLDPYNLVYYLLTLAGVAAICFFSNQNKKIS